MLTIAVDMSVRREVSNKKKKLEEQKYGNVYCFSGLWCSMHFVLAILSDTEW